MHDTVESVHLQGTIVESSLVREKERLVDFLTDSMKDEGLVRVLDMDPQWTLDFDKGRKAYVFDLTLYGVRVEGDAWAYSGMMNGALIPRYSTHSK